MFPKKNLGKKWSRFDKIGKKNPQLKQNPSFVLQKTEVCIAKPSAKRIVYSISIAPQHNVFWMDSFI